MTSSIQPTQALLDLLETTSVNEILFALAEHVRAQAAQAQDEGLDQLRARLDEQAWLIRRALSGPSRRDETGAMQGLRAGAARVARRQANASV